MRILLDTQVWLWLVMEPERLQGPSHNAVSDASNVLVLSAASSWEVAIKYSLGRLPLPEPPATFVPLTMQELGAVGLPIEHAHAIAVTELPRHHADPFDRLLIAQAQAESLTILSADPVFDAYDVDVLRA